MWRHTFPGSTVLPPPADHKGFVVADGSRIPHRGFVTTHVKTAEGQQQQITWKHADVDIPILSTRELARNGHRLEYDEDSGLVRNKATNETTAFVQRAGVYLMQLMVPKSIAHQPSQPFGRPG